MRSQSIPKISPSLFHRAFRRYFKSSGSMTIITAFVFLVFSTVALGILHITRVYIQLCGFKKNIIIMDYASENGIKTGFNEFLNLILAAQPLIRISEEQFNEIRAHLNTDGLQILRDFLTLQLPLRTSGNWESLYWNCETTSELINTIEDQNLLMAEFQFRFTSIGGIQNFDRTEKSALEARFHMAAGYIPLNTIPILTSPLSEKERAQISVVQVDRSHTPDWIETGLEEIFPKDVAGLASQALKIKLFSLRELNNRILRLSLGLEESTDPVPEGVYLVNDDLGLGGIYVEGDVDQMVLAVQDGFQCIAIEMGGDTWILKYNPGLSQTRFFDTGFEEIYDLLPRGIIMVNGQINSLGGGIIDSTGKSLITENEIPCLLDGASLTIISPHKISIRSHLLHQRLKWLDEIPYLQDTSSQLNILANGRNFTDEEAQEGRIVISREAPKNIKIQASLSASKGGLEIEGSDKTVTLFGNLHVPRILSENSQIRITPDRRFLETLSDNLICPRTSIPVLFMGSFRVVRWEGHEGTT
ncbi:hypothetical protein ACFLT9_03245 [Acidobacteriota bacterium]